MSAKLARQRYLQRHIEPDLPPCPMPATPWRNVLVIPAYRESATLPGQYSKPFADGGSTLLILVLNRPDSDPDDKANGALREAVCALTDGEHKGLKRLNSQTDLYLYDHEKISGPIPANQGVGLARKVGCDIAFKWQSAGAISSRWICCTDADAELPADYFSRLETTSDTTTAASFPFSHVPGPDIRCNHATALYELRLHHYVLGLEYAQSPYACHTLGSCLAVTFDAYAQVRGVPRRAGAEDFYLLNKLAKIAPVTRLSGSCLRLASRISSRVPFGTGPAVARISATNQPAELPLFEHPTCFEALRVFLQVVPNLRPAAPSQLPDMLAAHGLERTLAQAVAKVLDSMGFAAGLDHCRRQANTHEQFMRQFHQWFDGFRTLKFIHGIRDEGWQDLPLSRLSSERPGFWPAVASAEPGELCAAITHGWGWRDPH